MSHFLFKFLVWADDFWPEPRGSWECAERGRPGQVVQLPRPQQVVKLLRAQRGEAGSVRSGEEG